jgi:hypothetical protein
MKLSTILITIYFQFKIFKGNYLFRVHAESLICSTIVQIQVDLYVITFCYPFTFREKKVRHDLFGASLFVN